MVEWWERSSTTNEVRSDQGSIPARRHISEESLALIDLALIAKLFSGIFGFPTSTKTNISEFQFNSTRIEDPLTWLTSYRSVNVTGTRFEIFK